jgi:hypothetical protein
LSRTRIVRALETGQPELALGIVEHRQLAKQDPQPVRICPSFLGEGGQDIAGVPTVDSGRRPSMPSRTVRRISSRSESRLTSGGRSPGATGHAPVRGAGPGSPAAWDVVGPRAQVGRPSKRTGRRRWQPAQTARSSWCRSANRSRSWEMSAGGSTGAQPLSPATWNPHLLAENRLQVYR